MLFARIEPTTFRSIMQYEMRGMSLAAVSLPSSSFSRLPPRSKWPPEGSINHCMTKHYYVCFCFNANRPICGYIKLAIHFNVQYAKEDSHERIKWNITWKKNIQLGQHRINELLVVRNANLWMEINKCLTDDVRTFN